MRLLRNFQYGTWVQGKLHTLVAAKRRGANDHLGYSLGLTKESYGLPHSDLASSGCGPFLLVWRTFGLGHCYRPLVMASSCKVHTLGLPHLTLSSSWLTVSRLLCAFTLACGNLQGSLVLAADKQGLCSYLFTLTISLGGVSSLGMIPSWVKPKELERMFTWCHVKVMTSSSILLLGLVYIYPNSMLIPPNQLLIFRGVWNASFPSLQQWSLSHYPQESSLKYKADWWSFYFPIS